MRSFNNLTPAEAERLAYLIEEAAEVQQAACKILRHGYASHNPDNLKAGNNRDQLFRELHDLAGAVARMVRLMDFDQNPLDNGNPQKGDRYMHHQN